MKLTLKTKDLIAAMATLRKSMQARTTLPILEMVRIATKESGVCLSVTSLEIHLSITIPADIAEVGEVLVSARRLSGAAERGGDAECSLDLIKKELLFQCGKQRAKFATADILEFPAWPTQPDAPEIVMDGAELAEALRRVLPCLSNETGREALHGVHFHALEGKLTLVTTTGRTLCKVITSARHDGLSQTIPTQVARLLREFTGEIRLRIGDRGFYAESETLTLFGAVFDGSFPNYNQVIPSSEEVELRVTLNRDEMCRALQFVTSVYGSEFTQLVKLNIGSSAIVVRANSTENSADEEVPCVTTGKPFEIGFDAKILLRVLGIPSGEEVTMHLSHPNAPLTIVEKETTVVIMPMRFN